jgi:cell division protein FtsX
MPDSADTGERRRLDDYRLKQLEEGQEKLWRHMDQRFDALHMAIAQLPFVREDVYERDQRATEKAIDEAKKTADQRVADVEKDSENRDRETRQRADAAHRLAMVVFGLVATPLAGALIFWIAEAIR